MGAFILKNFNLTIFIKVLHGGFRNFRILPCDYSNFQMSKHIDFENDDDYSLYSVDNLEALKQQGWIPGQPCTIIVDGEGNLGPCLPLPPASYSLLLIGIGVSLLLSFWVFSAIRRIYRCKSRLIHLSRYINDFPPPRQSRFSLECA